MAPIHIVCSPSILCYTDQREFVESFWHWKDFMSYVKALGVMTGVLTVITFLFGDQLWFEVTLGTLSSGIEVSDQPSLSCEPNFSFVRQCLDFPSSG